MTQTQYDYTTEFLLPPASNPCLSCQLPSIRLALPEFFLPQPICISSDASYITFTPTSETLKKKRPRCRYEEVRRDYRCVFPGCSKAYGALNHLNSHIVDKNHGPKRQPEEFQQLRQQLKREKQLLLQNDAYQPTLTTTDSFIHIPLS